MAVTLKTDLEVIQQIFDHIDNGTTDLGDSGWQEPTENYISQARFDAEIALLRHIPLAFAPSAALREKGSYVARQAAGVPIVVVRDNDMKLRAFRNACRHRGMVLAEGEGKTSVFRCPYHGWAYGTNGDLQHIPHDQGFPDLDKSCHGLVPLHAVSEKAGLVFVSIEPPVDDGALTDLPEVIDSNQSIFDKSDTVQPLNWKLNTEATLEGYHIKPTHEKTFYPYGYDNLNVVETFGRNGRIVFPFRRIEKLREIPPEERDISGKVTFVYNIFPVCTVAVLSDHISISIAEPLSPTETRLYVYRLGQISSERSDQDIEKMRRDARFVADTGLLEDNAVVSGIQQGLSAGANSHFTYGLFEKAVVHFLKNLDELVTK